MKRKASPRKNLLCVKAFFVQVCLKSLLCTSFSAKELAVCKSFLCANFVSQSGTGTCFVQALSFKVVPGSTFCKVCSTKYCWEVVCESFVVQTSTGK